MDRPTLLGGREWSRGDAIGRHPYGWHCWAGEWLVLITTLEARLVHPSREARCQEAQVFQGGLCLSWLHKQASCLPASSTSSIPRETWPPVQGARSREAEGVQRSKRGWGLLLGIVIQMLPSPGRAVVPPVGPASHDLRTLCTRSLPSVSHRCWARARACGHNRPEKSLCQQIWKCSISSPPSHSVFLTDLWNGHWKYWPFL